jgi:hypothetical protein
MARYRGGGLALDLNISSRSFAGLQLTRKEPEVPFDLRRRNDLEEKREDVVSAYTYWLLHERVSVTLEARYQDFENGPVFDHMVLRELPRRSSTASPFRTVG